MNGQERSMFRIIHEKEASECERLLYYMHMHIFMCIRLDVTAVYTCILHRLPKVNQIIRASVGSDNFVEVHLFTCKKKHNTRDLNLESSSQPVVDSQGHCPPSHDAAPPC